ncbi:peptidyl-prolyl cis-trans isomerase [Tenacibaculum aiptasiae]|uniref:Peptidyl-prolyl cis-trans isomerase n=1 Tax=Tenacibaculum aiptasiae TaxID=426481 RepID=A0A7J5A7T2_9FLAO|nr:peptidylprolyl isomerase [Tenacibaculum aiptasiae]KAB1153616.1 peptidyl-prolyl cis-trans isomerase [Tenacibaculum aiptasiae]
MKRGFFFIVLLLIVSCDLISLKTEKFREDKPIATVYNKNLYKKDIEGLLPKGITAKDSLVIVKGLINSWAKQQLLLAKAEENISEVNSEKIESLVNDYKKSLYINGYKERLIKQQLDTIVTEEEIDLYYQKNKENFKLNEELLQFEYVHFGKDFLDKDEAIKKFKSSKEEDKEDLESYLLNFKSYRLQDSTWVTIDYLKKSIAPFQRETKENLLKISKFIQKEDSLGVYLVAVKNVLPRNATAPLTFVSSRIKQIILHKRKLELIREIEKTLINDAIQNKNFKEY